MYLSFSMAHLEIQPQQNKVICFKKYHLGSHFSLELLKTKWFEMLSSLTSL